MDAVVIAPLVIDGVERRFGRLAVLRDIHLRVDSGEVIGLLGANGSGKTTLLSICAGLLPASGGRCCFGARGEGELDVAGRRRLAFVAHSTQLYPRLDAEENLRLYASLRATTAAPDKVEFAALLRRVGLGDAGRRPVGAFSRGMQQRLAIARALLGTPDVLLLDEPFTALDHGGQKLLIEILLAERDRGAAILLSSHDLEAVAECSDRAVLLADGRIVATTARSGSTRDDYAARIRSLGAGAGREAEAAV